MAYRRRRRRKVRVLRNRRKMSRNPIGYRM